MAAAYEHFARVYDELHDEPLANATRIAGYLNRHLPGARSLLELGCGSGQVLAGLVESHQDRHQLRSVSGLDRSEPMLARARARLPAAQLVCGDITSFELAQRFDVVICVFDTLNHLEDFGLWRSLFGCVAVHLRSGGLFAFDVNTLGGLRRLAAAPPWLTELAQATVTQTVAWHGRGRVTWHVQIDQRTADGAVEHHHERIGELGVELAAISDALAADFTLLESSDDDGATPTDESPRAYFAYRRRPQ